MVAPTSKEYGLYASTNRLRLYSFGLLSAGMLVLGMVLFLLSHPYFLFYALFVITVTFYLLISYLVGIFSKDFDMCAHQNLLASFDLYRKPEKPTVDIYYCTCGEDIEVQQTAFDAIIKMQKAYGDECRIFILDDSKNNSSGVLVNKYFKSGLDSNVTYISRNNKGFLKKAGNLRNAFVKTDGKYIAVFDADFCPSENFLFETIPYLELNKKIAILQTPQYFSVDHEHTWVEKGASYIQELFYRLIQVNRDYYNGSICVGTCAVYRREALEPHGGPAPVEYSEDVRTGFLCIQNGWLVKYIPVILSKGRCPDTVPAFLMQQHRWAMGSITLFLSKEFWKTKLGIMQRMCYLSGMLYYVVTGIGLVFVSLPSILLLIFRPDMVHWYNALFSVPSFLFGTLFQAYWSVLPFGIYAMEIKIISYHAHLFALLEKLSGNITPWVATGVVTKNKLYTRFQRFLFWNTVIPLTLTLILIGYRSHEFGLINFLPVLFFTLLNAYLNLRILRDQI